MALNFISSNIRIENVDVFGLAESIRASKFPMSTNIEELTSAITPRQSALGSCIPGTGHDCYLKGIIVQMDLTLPQYIWQQIKRYHFFDTVSSQSTMHRITKMDIAGQCTPEVDKSIIKLLTDLIKQYNDETDPVWKKQIFVKIVANIPSGLMLSARVTTNYLQLKTIYNQRKTHKLEEWVKFCNYVETLPMFEELVLNN